MNKKNILTLFFISLILLITLGILFKSGWINLDFHKQEREELLSELTEVDTIEKCKSISEKIVKLGPICSGDICMPSGQFYRDYMISCIISIAVRQNNQNLCLDKKTNEDMCVEWVKLAEFPFDEPSPECVRFVEKECLLRFLSKPTPETTITIDCNSFEEDYEKDDCFKFLATAKLDPDVCLNISSIHSQGKCMNYFAFRNNDISLCNYGRDWQIKGCKEALDILRNNDISICEEIGHFYESTPGKESCYLGFAIFNRDPSICSRYKDKGPFIDDVCERYTK